MNAKKLRDRVLWFMADEKIENLINQEYRHGFITNIEQETFRAGLDAKIIAQISARKNEPDFMLQWRLDAYKKWLNMKEPTWAHIRYTPIDYQSISYYSAPKSD